ncbi:MAG: DUF1573 domain-containing protein [Verrucomicrobiae bacterium]|nr:DUF1573 domain-containing protein [Verrucomicrobiae bacterium]
MTGFVRCLMGAFAFLAGCPSPGWGQLQWQMRDLNFKPALMETNVVARFPFQNAGRRPVKLLAIQSSCGCTRVDKEKKTYASGEKGEIVADFVFGDRVGLQRKRILVQTDDPGESTVVLNFSVEIPEVCKAGAAFALWKIGEKKDPKTINIKTAPEVKKVTMRMKGAGFLAELNPTKNSGEYEVKITPLEVSRPVMAVIELQLEIGNGVARHHSLFALVKSDMVRQLLETPENNGK